MPTPSWTNTFGNLAGNQTASKIDENFSEATQVTSLAVSPQTPLIPVVGGAVGTDGYAAAADHQHPPQAATINTIAGTTYTLDNDDDGLVGETTNGSAVTITLSAATSVGKSGLIAQCGAGQVTFTAASGATIRQSSSYTKTRAQWSQVSWRVRANSGGSAAEYVLSGDMTS